MGIVGFLMGSAFLFDPPSLRRTARIDWWGLGLMITGFACLQLVLDRGEREEWFDSTMIVALAIVAACALAGFLIRELTTSDPILDLAVFADRNFATGAALISIVGFGMFSGMLLVAVFTQKLLGYDAWTSGLVLAPGGLGNIFSLFASGLVTRVDQRLMLAFGCLLNAASLYMMTSLTLGMDYWALAWPRFIQGFAVGFIFVPLSTLTLATIRRDKLVNATAAYGMLRNLGGSVGIARRHHAARAAQPVPPGHAGQPRHAVGPRDACPPRAVGQPLRDPAAATPSPPSARRSPCCIARPWRRPSSWRTRTTSGCWP